MIENYSKKILFFSKLLAIIFFTSSFFSGLISSSFTFLAILSGSLFVISLIINFIFLVSLAIKGKAFSIQAKWLSLCFCCFYLPQKINILFSPSTAGAILKIYTIGPGTVNREGISLLKKKISQGAVHAGDTHPYLIEDEELPKAISALSPAYVRIESMDEHLFLTIKLFGFGDFAGFLITEDPENFQNGSLENKIKISDELYFAQY